MKYILILVVTAYGFLLVNSSNAQTAAADNKLSQTITFRPIPMGSSVFGVFEGRPPCTGIATQLNITTPTDCEKLKWRLTLHQDPVKLQPSGFTLLISGAGDEVKQTGSSYRQILLKGKWGILKGIKSNSVAEVYKLEFDKPGTDFYLLKGDNNVLFVLDENKEFRIGNSDFSYTLNRVELVPGNK